MEQLGMEGLGLTLISLGVVMYANRAGYLFFTVGIKTVLGFAAIGGFGAYELLK